VEYKLWVGPDGENRGVGETETTVRLRAEGCWGADAGLAGVEGKAGFLAGRMGHEVAGLKDWASPGGGQAWSTDTVRLLRPASAGAHFHLHPQHLAVSAYKDFWTDGY
jgi:uncharacterized protein (UPF0128 family)